MTFYRKPHACDLRKGRFSQAHQVYSITTVTENRLKIFEDLYSARLFVQVLREHEKLCYAETLCFVVMPDHVHWLMQLGDKRSLSKVMKSVKSISSHYIGRALWQKGFYDYALRHEDDIKGIARYIVANPLRAGLVKNIGDYPHWYAKWL